MALVANNNNVASMAVQPNLPDYPQTRAFSWKNVRRELSGLPECNGLNIAYEAVDRHAAGPLAKRVAVRCLSKDGTVTDLTYRKLKERSNRFARLLGRLGMTRGERVFWLAGRIPSLYPVFFGTLKNRNVFCPLFSTLGPKSIFQRLERGNARVLVTTQRHFKKKVADLLPRLSKFCTVLLVDREQDLDARVLSLPRLMAQSSGEFAIPPTNPDDMAMLHFTSGTTGMPKGAMYVHNGVLTHCLTGRYVLDLRPEDIFWCTVDPGWVTGTSYGIIAPLVQGITSIVDEADFEPERWYRILYEQRVSVSYTAPKAVRMLIRAPLNLRRRIDLSALRLVHSVGEPNPEAVL